MLYGHEKTIHQTTGLDVEVDQDTGEVVSVWFRCMALPFHQVKVDHRRGLEMRKAYANNKRQHLVAVEITELTDDERRTEALGDGYLD